MRWDAFTATSRFHLFKSILRYGLAGEIVMKRQICGVAAALAFAAPASASDFYAIDMPDDHSVVLVEPAQIQTLGDQHKLAAFHVVQIDDIAGAPAPFATLDTTNLEMDCATPRLRVTSEYFYPSLNASAEKIDETSANSPEWQTPVSGGTYEHYRMFVCQWPNLSEQFGEPPAKASYPDVWSAAKASADILIDMSHRKDGKDR